MRNILLIICIFISTEIYSQISEDKFISNPIKRVKKITYLESNDLSIPVYINDSTTRKIYERHFIYTNNRVSRIETKWFKNNDYTVKKDSIIYISNDSIMIFKSENNRLFIESQKLPQFLDVFRNLNKSITENSGLYLSRIDLRFRIKDGLIKKIELSENGVKYKTVISYDKKNNPLEFITNRTGSIKGESWCRIRNINRKDFELSCGSGKMWYSSDFFYFDIDGYLIKRIVESDTNPHIMIINYENGNGNASDFIYYKNYILTLEPLIY